MSGACTCSCKIGPSILNADLSRLGDECQRLMDGGADYIHLDVMDGHFVPNITFGATTVKWLRKRLPGVFFDMHMMVSEPEKWVDDMADAGANQYTFHLEATSELTTLLLLYSSLLPTFFLPPSRENPRELIKKIKEKGMKVGIGIKPATPVEEVLPYVSEVDMVLIMTVEPGFGGQKFMADMMPKVKHLRTSYPVLDIEVDGGVSPSTIEEAAKAGANMIVSGSAVVNSPNPREVIDKLRSITEKWIKVNAHS